MAFSENVSFTGHNLLACVSLYHLLSGTTEEIGGQPGFSHFRVVQC